MTKKMTIATAKAAELERKAKHDEQATKAAVEESARVRAMFDEDRKALAKRYGVISPQR